MVKRRDGWRWRRALILGLFLLVPALLSDLPVFSKSGHKHEGGVPAAQPALSGDPTRLAILAGEPGALGTKRGHRHWHTADGAEGSDEDGLLQNLVYLTHAKGAGDGDKIMSDGFGGDGGRGDGGTGSGGGGFGGGPFGFGPPNDPGTDILPLAFNPGPATGDGPSFPSPGLPGVAAVPEPATWALFILGFGFIGTVLRRARDTAPALTRARSGRLG